MSLENEPTPVKPVTRKRRITKQTSANRRNAKKSTGPRTAEGKERSSANAIKHGLCADRVLLPDEDREEFLEFSDVIYRQYYPWGGLEECLVERITVCLWRLRRASQIEAVALRYFQKKYEAEACERMHDRIMQSKNQSWSDSTFLPREQGAKVEELNEKIDHFHEQGVEGSLSLGAAFVMDAMSGNALTKLGRYESHIERSLYRALHELKIRQSAHLIDNPGGPLAIDDDGFVVV